MEINKGQFLNAAEDYNIDFSNSWMVGDGENDIKAGKGCKTALIGEGEFSQDMTGDSLLGIINALFSYPQSCD